MNVAIIGCGLIGNKRALALDKNSKLIACCDTNTILAQNFAHQHGCKPYSTYNDLLLTERPDAVIVSVINKFAKDIVIRSLSEGIHVLAEKPLGRNAFESEEILNAQHLACQRFAKNIVLKTGFNHRFHPAIQEAKKQVDAGIIGKIMYLRARYGHGGRPGMEQEWRSSKELCGGGELLDQGVHLIDLINWLSGTCVNVFGKICTLFWPIEVEDNAFVLMQYESGIHAQFHVSWTNWKNIFSLEIFGENGYISIQGLGGSYGTETLEIGIRKKEGGRPDIVTREFTGPDESWQLEWENFLESVRNPEKLSGSGTDGHLANVVIDAIYKSSATGSKITLQ